MFMVTDMGFAVPASVPSRVHPANMYPLSATAATGTTVPSAYVGEPDGLVCPPVVLVIASVRGTTMGVQTASTDLFLSISMLVGLTVPDASPVQFVKL